MICFARCPLETDWKGTVRYFLQCEREKGHDGKHAERRRKFLIEWTELTEGEKIEVKA